MREAHRIIDNIAPYSYSLKEHTVCGTPLYIAPELFRTTVTAMSKAILSMTECTRFRMAQDSLTCYSDATAITITL